MRLVLNRKIVDVMLMVDGLKMVLKQFLDIAISVAVVKVTHSDAKTLNVKIIMNVFQLMNDPTLAFVKK